MAVPVIRPEIIVNTRNRIQLVIELHPLDYQRFVESSRRAGIPLAEFGPLAVHRGVKVINQLMVPAIGREDSDDQTTS
jgi:hypothetical protein